MYFKQDGRQQLQAHSTRTAPIASSIVIKTLSDMQNQLAHAIDKHVSEHPAPGPKDRAPAELIRAWEQFPRSSEWYVKQVTRLANIAASVHAEQAVTELVLQWLPPAFGSAQPGQAFLRSQFGFERFTKQLRCLSLAQTIGGSERKEIPWEIAARTAEEARNMETVQMVVCVAVCDLLVAVLQPREGRSSPIDPDIGNVCVQLAFAQFYPQSERANTSRQLLHPDFATSLSQRTVASWSSVLGHLARSRFDQIVREFAQRIHHAKSTDEVLILLVGIQSVTIPHISAPACAPLLDQFRQIVTSDKKLYKIDTTRLCLAYNLEQLVRQIDCGQIEGDMRVMDSLYTSLHAMFNTLQEWGEKPEIQMTISQLLALIVCHSPPAFWQSHMDVSKEGKKHSNQLLGGKKVGLLRRLLTEQAYDDKSSRAALCGVLRLLTGGFPLPTSILGQPSDAEWWRMARDANPEKVSDDSLMNHTMRTFAVGVAAGADAAKEIPIRQSKEMMERLRFVVEKLFSRKAAGRTVRLPRLLECGDVLVYLIGQVAAHDLTVGMEAIEALLSDPKDIEYNLIGVCALGRVLKAANLKAALAEQRAYFADRIQMIVERCDCAVGSRVMGLANTALGIAPLVQDDSVQVLLTNVSRRKDRELAVRIAMYREAIGCIPMTLPPACLMTHQFVGELILHADGELANQASRVVQQLTLHEPSTRKDMLACFANLLTNQLTSPGGSSHELRGEQHATALDAMEQRLYSVTLHVTHLLSTWAAALRNERAEVEPLQMEIAGSQVMHARACTLSFADDL
jgi:hypothetical protein